MSGTSEDGGTVSASDTAILDSDFFTPVTGTCTVDPFTMCPLERYQVDVDWRDLEGNAGTGWVVPGQRFFDGGEFYFFDPSHSDVFLQMADACSQSGYFTVLYGNDLKVLCPRTLLH